MSSTLATKHCHPLRFIVLSGVLLILVSLLFIHPCSSSSPLPPSSPPSPSSSPTIQKIQQLQQKPSTPVSTSQQQQHEQHELQQLLLLLYTHVRQSYDWMERMLQVITVSLTNMFALPALFICYSNGMYGQIVIGFMTLLTSTLYHTCETLRIKIWGMNDGKWHRLDNVFIILSIQQIIVYMLLNDHVKFIDHHSDGHNDDDHSDDDTTTTLITRQKKSEIKLLEKHVQSERNYGQWLQWFGLAHCLTCQEKSPWNEYYTYTPIVTLLIMALIRFIYTGFFKRINRLSSQKNRDTTTSTAYCLRPRYYWKRIALSFICLLIAIAFFVMGLDDDNDFIQLNIVDQILPFILSRYSSKNSHSVAMDATKLTGDAFWSQYQRSKPVLRVWRIYHGLWHVFISFSFFCLYYSKKTFESEKTRRQQQRTRTTTDKAIKQD